MIFLYWAVILICSSILVSGFRMLIYYLFVMGKYNAPNLDEVRADVILEPDALFAWWFIDSKHVGKYDGYNVWTGTSTPHIWGQYAKSKVGRVIKLDYGVSTNGICENGPLIRPIKDYIFTDGNGIVRGFFVWWVIPMCMFRLENIQPLLVIPLDEDTTNKLDALDPRYGVA